MSTDPPIIIDFEASGFGKGSYPIEVGFIDHHGSTWCSLITPVGQWDHWDDGAEKVHHIARPLLFRHGRKVEAIVDMLNHRLAGYTVYSDGWYHDYTWMARLYDAANTYPSFRLEDLRAVLSPSQEEKWHQTKDRLAVQLATDRHRASHDARLLQQTWLETR